MLQRALFITIPPENIALEWADMADSLPGLHDQGAWCSNLFPPATSSSPLSQILTIGFSGCLRVWASRAWVNAATHLLNPLLWIHSRTVLTATARCSLLPYFHFPTYSPPAFCGFWTAEELKMLFMHTSLYCVVLLGSHRLHLFSCSR